MSQSWYSKIDDNNKNKFENNRDRFLDFSELIENKLLNNIVDKIGKNFNDFIEHIDNLKFDHK